MKSGYRSVTMDMVAAQAGVTKAAVYYHFKDKGSLFISTARSILSQARRATENILALRRPLRERLHEIASVVLALPLPFTSFDAMMHEAASDLSAEQLRQVRHQEQRVVRVVENAIVEAARAREIRTDDPALAAHAFLAMLRVGQMRDEKGAFRFPDTERTAERIISLLWEGVGPPS